jgi:hypothetical protein
MTDQLMKRANLAHYGIRLMLAAAVAVSASCSDLGRQGKSPSYLLIGSLTGQSGADPGTFSTQLNSDVQTLVSQQIGGQTVRVPTIFNDLGQATLRALLKNRGTVESPTTPTPVNAVTITRYHVEFKRADGRNEPGRDVPYGFDGGVTTTITDSETLITFDLVRHTNKQEPPLRNLINSGGQNQINTIAEVTFYGRDQAGNEVSVTGLITVNFADFGDPS